MGEFLKSQNGNQIVLSLFKKMCKFILHFSESNCFIIKYKNGRIYFTNLSLKLFYHKMRKWANLFYKFQTQIILSLFD